MAEKIWFLKRCNLFEQLASDELAALEGRCRMRHFPRKCPVYLPADEAESVLLLASGRVKICSVTPDGRQGILAFIEAGELFGELAVLDETQRQEYAETLEPSTVILIPRASMQQLMDHYPDVTLGITRLIGLRRRRVERRLKHLLFLSSRDRLVHLLLELAEQYGKPTATGVHINLKLSHQDLANIIGSTRETVTVVLQQLLSQQCVQIGRQRVVLTDLKRLAASVELEPPALPHSGDSARRRAISQPNVKLP